RRSRTPQQPRAPSSDRSTRGSTTTRRAKGRRLRRPLPGCCMRSASASGGGRRAAAGGGSPAIAGRGSAAGAGGGLTAVAAGALHHVVGAVHVDLHLAAVGLRDGHLEAVAGEVRGHGACRPT